MFAYWAKVSHESAKVRESVSRGLERANEIESGGKSDASDMRAKTLTR